MTQPEEAQPTEAQGRFGLVLILVLVTYGFSASDVQGTPSGVILFGLQAATLWLVLGETGSRKVQRLIGAVVLLFFSAAAIALTIGGDASSADLTRVLASALLYLVAPLAILRQLATRQSIDLQTLLATIATYVMIGMFFAYSFEAVALLQDGPFFGEAGDGSRPEFLFFSFTTLLTVGYGNLVPAGNPGQTMAMMEAMSGQLFLIIAVARVVTLIGRPREPIRQRST